MQSVLIVRTCCPLKVRTPIALAELKFPSFAYDDLNQVILPNLKRGQVRC
jgi:hypothetical protein